MKVEILKVPDALNFGRAAGDVCEVQDSVGLDWIDNGWAKEVSSKHEPSTVDEGSSGVGSGDGSKVDAPIVAHDEIDSKPEAQKAAAKPAGARDKAVHSKDHLR